MVQTGLIIKANEAFHGDRSLPTKRPLDTVQWLADAYKLAPSIPGDVSAVEAAEAFLTWVIDRDRLDDRDRFILGVLLEDPEAASS